MRRSSRGYWTCQLLGWGLWGASLAYSAIATLPVPWARVLLDITLLNAAAVGFTQVLRGFMLRRGWTKLSMVGLLPRLLVASVLLALPLAVGNALHVGRSTVGTGVGRGQALLEAIPGPLRNIDPLLLRTINWSTGLLHLDGPVHRHHVGTRPA